MGDDSRRPIYKVALWTGFLSWVGDAILYPLDTISTRLKGNAFHHHASFPYMWKSLRMQGMSLFRGITITIPHTFFGQTIYLSIYEYFSRLVSDWVDGYTEDKKVKLFFPFFTSAFAELVSLVIELPIETLRTRVQMHSEYEFKSFWSGLEEIYQTEGLLRFYKSAKIYICCRTVYSAIQLQAYEMIRFYGGPSGLWLFANTIISTALATTILNPLEVLLTRYALVDTRKSKLLFFKIVREIYVKEGWIGFYKGCLTEVLIHSLYSLFWMPAFQLLREGGIQLQN